jgi:hypothetical protein
MILIFSYNPEIYDPLAKHGSDHKKDLDAKKIVRG